jgi:hypothetical protein
VDRLAQVARFGGEACARVRLRGASSDEHSFFPPYSWRMAECAHCGAHLGWSFGAETGDAVFLGLVLTHLRERMAYESELAHMRSLVAGVATDAADEAGEDAIDDAESGETAEHELRAREADAAENDEGDAAATSIDLGDVDGFPSS